MDLLFKETTFSREFKEVLGFVDADMSYRNLRADLRSATNEMIDLIGTDMYALVITAYDAVTGDNFPELVEQVRYPIALNAYRKYAPTNDLNHTNNGRMMRKSENEVAPFNWMIELDNKNQERKYYAALDALLQYLETEGGEAWKTSPANQKLKGHFINTTADFDATFPIQSRLLLLKLMPGIKKAEREHILPSIGQERFTLLKTQIKNSTDIEEINQPLFQLIKDACVYFALSWAMKRLAVTLFPEGILQQYISDTLAVKASKTPEFLQTQLADEQFHLDAMGIMQDIQALIAKQNEGIKPVATYDDLGLNLGLDFGDGFVNT